MYLYTINHISLRRDGLLWVLGIQVWILTQNKGIDYFYNLKQLVSAKSDQPLSGYMKCKKKLNRI